MTVLGVIYAAAVGITLAVLIADILISRAICRLNAELGRVRHDRDQWRDLATHRFVKGAHQAIADGRAALAEVDATLTDTALRQEDQS